jgi:hypothetical protein
MSSLHSFEILPPPLLRSALQSVASQLPAPANGRTPAVLLDLRRQAMEIRERIAIFVPGLSC